MFNNAGQHYNHIHFWKWMKKGGGGDKIPGKLKAAVERDLGGVAKAKADFIAAGVGQFGSGWCWIAVKDGKLMIDKTPNGESPLVQGRLARSSAATCGSTPITSTTATRRPKYLEAFWDSLINWEDVDQALARASKQSLRTVLMFGKAGRAASGSEPLASFGPVILEIRLDRPFQLDGQRVTLAVERLAGRDADPAFADAIFLHVGLLLPAKRMPMPRSSSASS